MISARVDWAGEAALEGIVLVTTEAITRATVHLWTAVQAALNVPNTGERRKKASGASHGPRKGRAASYTVYPHPSKPGESPRKRTGWLQRNVKYEVSREGVGRVGVTRNALYGLFLELGTARVRPRPWLLATVSKELPALQAIVMGTTK